ncbi:MAG: menaquinone-dependent protoporphyrinogen IX dehydrogenase [Sulfuricella sp.]
MASILIIYSTTDGHTLKICQRLQMVIEQQNHRVKLASVNDEPDAELNLFDKIVIGASIRYGKHRPQVYDFIKRNENVLEGKPSAFFSVNVVARKPEKNRPETNPYITQFQKKTSWQPKELAVFAGKIDYQKYRFWDRQLIRFIMWMTKGPTHPKTVAEFTNWEEVEAFGQRVCEM